MNSSIWVLPALPLAGAVVLLLAGRRSDAWGHLLGVLMALASFAFGLVHGFGFAGALAASMGSLRTQGHDWLLNLAAFNLGIEAFQLGLVILLVPMLSWVARRAWSGRVFDTLSFIVMSAGLVWLFSRI